MFPRSRRYVAIALTPAAAGLLATTVITTPAHADSGPIGTTLTASLSTEHAIYGQRLTISGTADYYPDGDTAPLADARVQIYNDNTGDADVSSNGLIATVVTDTHGNFSYKLPVSAATDWYVQIDTSQSGPSLAPAAATPGLYSLDVPMGFYHLTATQRSHGNVTVSGCLDSVPGVPFVAESGYDNQNIHVQYARSPKGTWHTIASQVQFNSLCGRNGMWFSTYQHFKLASPASDYYRATFSGFRPDTIQLMAADSQPIRVRR
jgi:hypothetical protein